MDEEEEEEEEEVGVGACSGWVVGGGMGHINAISRTVSLGMLRWRRCSVVTGCRRGRMYRVLAEAAFTSGRASPPWFRQRRGHWINPGTVISTTIHGEVARAFLPSKSASYLQEKKGDEERKRERKRERERKKETEREEKKAVYIYV